MKHNQIRFGEFTRFITLAVFGTLILLGLTTVVVGQTNETPATTESATSDEFDQEHLEQLVAPIALYPDALLMQIMMASTYPLEIVEADRWIRENPDLTGDALDNALLEKNWDPSVKSLTTLPNVLRQMSENLDWTQDLGDAFLAQQNDLLDTAQRMRGLAYDAGNLETTEQQAVTQQEDKIIVIESTSPEVIYVPTYSPTVVYGAWYYPYWFYPRWYYPPRPGYGFVAFGAGVVVGAAIWGGCRWGWGRNNVNINVNRHNEFNRRTNINADRDRINSRGSGGKADWKHNSNHRKGVNYRNSDVAKKYGASSGSNRVTQNQARGRTNTAAANRGGAATTANRGNKASAANRGGATTRANKSGVGTQASNRSGASSRTSPSTANRSYSGNRSAYSGSRNPSYDRASSYRGASSRGHSSYGGSRGGMRRSGGRRR